MDGVAAQATNIDKATTASVGANKATGVRLMLGAYAYQADGQARLDGITGVVNGCDKFDQ